MEKKIEYKIIFSDLDETLLIENHIPSFNLEAINKAKEKGIKFVISTGRNYNSISHLLKELNTYNLEKEYTICSSGSIIYENKNKKIIYFKGIDDDTLKLIFEYGKRIKNIFIIFDTLDGSFVYNEEMIEKEEFKYSEYIAIKNLDEINSKIIRIIFSKKDFNYLLKIQNDIKNNKLFEGKVSFIICCNKFLEFNAYETSKGEALKWLSNYLNIDVKETIAIGDSYNDESMIKVAGLGCCVKSAKDDIKNISKYICQKDYFEGSVKEVIDKFILND